MGGEMQNTTGRGKGWGQHKKGEECHSVNAGYG